jgi:circularin A/uberolysin family circular bacteriocin
MNLNASQQEKVIVSTLVLIAIIMIGFLGTVTGDISVTSTGFSGQSSFLASKLGLTNLSANRIVYLIDTGSTIMTIVSIVTAVTGAGLIAAGGIAGIKYVIKKQGKDKAAAW